MALSALKLFRGVIDIDFQDATTSRFKRTGIKAEIPTLTITPKTDSFEIADGTEYQDDKGSTGEFVFAFEELDDTDLTALTTYAPGTTDGIDSILVTFTQLGNGTNHTVRVGGVTALKKGLETGKAWKTVLTATVSAAAGVPLEDMITVTRPA